MDFQCTQVADDDGSSESSGYASTDDKVQVGTLEIGSNKHVILKGLTKVGRHPACEICLQDTTVSKIHAEIEANGKNIFICDLQSSNKTRMNDAILLPSRFYEVADGVSLKFGIVDARFFLKRPEDSSILAPETPEPGLRPRHETSGDNSLVEATPNPRDDPNFRRPALPTHRRSRLPFTAHSDDQTVPEEDIQNAETQLGGPEDISELETQLSTLKNDDVDIHEMSTKVAGVKIHPQTVTSEPKNVVNIQEMETQVMSDVDNFETTLNRPTTSRNLRSSSDDDDEDTEGASGDSKKALNSRKNAPRLTHSIQDLETQIFDPEEEKNPSENRLKSLPCRKTTIHDLETQRFETEEKNKLPKSAFVSVKRLPDVISNNDSTSQSSIHDLQTQPVEPDEDLDTLETKITPSALKKSRENGQQRLSQFKEDLQTVKSDIFGSEPRRSHDDDDEEMPDIYDLPTQTNFEYSEAKKRKKEEINESRRTNEVSKSTSSSPDLLGTGAHVFIDDSDELTDEEGVFDDFKPKIGAQTSKNVGGEHNRHDDDDDKMGKNIRVIVDSDNDDTDVSCNSRNNLPNNCDKSRGKMDKGKVKKNGIVSDSDSDDDNADMMMTSKSDSKCSKSSREDHSNELNVKINNGEIGGKNKIQKLGRIYSHDLDDSGSGGMGKSVIEASGSDTDYDPEDDKMMNSAKSSGKSVLNNSGVVKPGKSAPEKKKKTSGDSDGNGIHSEDELTNSRIDLESTKSDDKSALSINEGSESETDSEGEFLDQKSALKSSKLVSEDRKPVSEVVTDYKRPIASAKSGPKSSKKSSYVISDSSDDSASDSYYKKTSKSSKNGLKKSKSSKSSAQMSPTASRTLPRQSEGTRDNKTPEKSGLNSKNSSKSPDKSLSNRKTSSKNPLEGLNTSDIPPHILHIMKSSVNPSENRLDDDDDDDPYSAPTQLISLPKFSKTRQKSLKNSPESSSSPRHRGADAEEIDDDSPTQKIDMNYLKNRKTHEIDDLAPTQVIPTPSEPVKRHHGAVEEEDDYDDDDDLAPTQVIDLPERFKPLKRGVSRKFSVVDDLAPTQVIMANQVHGITSRNIPGPSGGRKYDAEEDFAQTQVIDASPKKRTYGDAEAFNDIQTKRMRFDDLDDTDPTQIIHVEPPKCSKSQKNLPKTSKIANLTPRNAKKVPKSSIYIRSSDSEDLEKSPRVVTRARKGPANTETPAKKLDFDENLEKNNTSTPCAPSPGKKRKFSLSLRARREADSKESGFNESRSNSSEKSSRNAQKTNENLEDSISVHLDSMFGGHEDKKTDVGGPLMTQQLVDILQPTQSPPDSPKPTKSSKNTSKKSQNAKAAREKGSGKVPEVEAESQDDYFTNLKSKKRRNVLETGSSDDEQDISGFEKGIAVKVAQPITSPSRKSSRIQRNLKGKMPSKTSGALEFVQGTSKPSTSKKILRKNEDISNFPMSETFSRPGTPTSPISSRMSSKGSNNVPSTSKYSPGMSPQSPGKFKIQKSEFPKISIQKIDKKMEKKLVDSSDDDDDDFESIIAKADGFLTSSGAGKSPGRGKKPLSLTKTLPKKDLVEKSKEIGESLVRGRPGGRKNISQVVGKTLKKIPDEDLEKKQGEESAKFTTEKAVETPKKRGRKILEKIPDVQEKIALEEVKVPEVGRKRGRPKKNDDEEVNKSKRTRRDDSGESSPGLESQEISRILQGAEESKVQENIAEGAVKGSKKKADQGDVKVKEKKKKNEVKDSPSKAVRSRSFLEQDKAHCVLFTGVKDAEEGNAHSVTELGGTVTSDPLKATILVTDKVRRTIKFFCAVSRGIPIVSITWMESSVASNRFLDPNKYILHDPTSESRFRFSLRKSLTRAKDKKLLDGKTIVLTSKLIGPSIPELKTMVQVSGGKALVRAPASWPDQCIIVSCDEDMPRVKKMIAKVRLVKVHVVSIEFLLSGILRQQLDYNEFALRV